MKSISISILSTLALGALLVGCGDSDAARGATGPVGPAGSDGPTGPAGLVALVAVSDEGAGADCEAGGKRIDFGADDDGSGTLEEGEIEATEYVCNGANGADGVDGTTGMDGATGE